MAKIFTCDRCGKPIKKCHERIYTRLENTRWLLTIELSDYEAYDLCTGCALKVRDFIENNSVGEDKEA